MPKVDIDYSNTIFYKIFCKNSSITDLYVGLTTNFVQRRHAHKQSCKNEKATNHNCKLYNTIRNAGGWDNWQMEIIAFHNCADSYEAHKKEQEYFEQLGATLNSIDPLPKPKIKDPSAKIVPEKPKLFCEPCKVYFSHWKAQDVHNNTKKHHKMVATFNQNNLNLNKNILIAFTDAEEIVDVKNTEAFWGNKKFALTLGIKAATKDYLLFTDADCYPTSKDWITLMSSQFTLHKTFVLGYGAYEKVKGSFLNKIIRFDALLNATQYFSWAKIGRPYMGIGRNLAYKKDEFFKVIILIYSIPMLSLNIIEADHILENTLMKKRAIG